MAITRTFVALVGAAHPEPAAAVTVGSAVLAVATGRDAPGVAAVGAAILASQLAVGWHNDWLDVDRDRAAGRTDKPLASGALSPRTVIMAAIVAAAVTVPLALLSGVVAGLFASLALASALAYNWPVRFTALSPLPYVVSFGALPAYVVLGLPGHKGAPWWLVAAGAALGGGAHFANVLPDLDDDIRHGIRGLPHRVGRTASTAIAGALLALVSALLVVGPPGPPSAIGLIGLCGAVLVLLIGGYVQARRPETRAAFRSVLVAALIDVALLLAAGTSL